MNKISLPWFKERSPAWQTVESSCAAEIDLDVYSLEAVMKTCYLFLDQCYLFIEKTHGNIVRVYISPRNSTDDLAAVTGEFSNRLLWQETRLRVSAETQAVRELIVEQAFAEAGILKIDSTEADYNLDPLGIAK